MSIFEASYTSSSYSGQTNNIIIYVLFTSIDTDIVSSNLDHGEVYNIMW
jgi:hypothetical protein